MRSRYGCVCGMYSLCVKRWVSKIDHLLIATLFFTSLHGVELRIGKGEFQTSMGIHDFWQMSAKSDIDVISISQPRYNLNETLYLFGTLDIYSSPSMEAVSQYIDTVMNATTPFGFTPNTLLGTFVPVPNSYEIEGVDVDIGITKEMIKSRDYSFGVGVVTGFSTPIMKMENYFEAFNFYADILDYTQTKLKTYKAGIVLEGSLNLNESITLSSKATYAYQQANLTNSIMQFDSDGKHRTFETNVQYTPKSLKNIYLNAGYSYKDWQVDSMQGAIMGISTPNVSAVVDIELSSRYGYVGIGYKF